MGSRSPSFGDHELKETHPDNLLARYRGLVALKPVSRENCKSFSNWIDGSRPLVRSEARVWDDLEDLEDFVQIADEPHDYGLLDQGIESLLPKFSSCFGYSCVRTSYFISARYLVTCELTVELDNSCERAMLHGSRIAVTTGFIFTRTTASGNWFGSLLPCWRCSLSSYLSYYYT